MPMDLSMIGASPCVIRNKNHSSDLELWFQLVKKLPISPRFLYNKGNGGVYMDQLRKDARKEPIIIDIDSLVPADHLLRKIEKVMDYE